MKHKNVTSRNGNNSDFVTSIESGQAGISVQSVPDWPTLFPYVNYDLFIDNGQFLNWKPGGQVTGCYCCITYSHPPSTLPPNSTPTLCVLRCN